MRPPIVIDRPGDIRDLVKVLRRHRRLAVDTESNGYHAYTEKICLIQISTASRDYIIDPLACGDIQALGEVLADPGIEKIFHAAANDITGIRRDFRFTVESLFDTAIACKLLGFEQLGLSKIIQEFFAVTLDKKFQRCNWAMRPLSAEQLEYARLDTHFLLALRHRLAEALHERQLWDEAQLAFVKASTQELPSRQFDPRGHLRIHGANTLSKPAKQLLGSLYHYRDARARQLDRAPFRVLSNELLVRLARRRPQQLGELTAVPGLPRNYRNGRLAQELLEVLRSTPHDSPPPLNDCHAEAARGGAEGAREPGTRSA
jgi:ribonuclease D